MITPQVFGDARGYFMETYNYNDSRKPASIRFSYRTTSPHPKRRSAGLHFQINYPQDKLVRAIRGEVFDVAADLRPGSKTYGQWSVCLSEENKKQFFIPKNFAHGFECCRIMRNLPISAPTFIIPTTKAVWHGTIPRSA